MYLLFVIYGLYFSFVLSKISAIGIPFFSAAGIPEQKEEKTSKRSQPVAMFPCFSLPAVCARAIQKVELGIWIQCYGKFSCETHFAIFRVFRKPW